VSVIGGIHALRKILSLGPETFFRRQGRIGSYGHRATQPRRFRSAVRAHGAAGISPLDAERRRRLVREEDPIPGNLVGMVALYALLALGIVKLAWFETADRS
jgi:hypothetical protein